ncbi:hypothetical protein ADUPG1_008245 [Aduncisulcus paluster]|uniref:Uncharacterized protein n=1 Tax=Aduncisulcus paluster TaxID=2918883 RepID=A0ABQ5KR87_9EUKA|nr:hypothetical protein ADUPG1_008245 [Aduncisulcus paluster]
MEGLLTEVIGERRKSYFAFIKSDILTLIFKSQVEQFVASDLSWIKIPKGFLLLCSHTARLFETSNPSSWINALEKLNLKTFSCKISGESFSIIPKPSQHKIVLIHPKKGSIMEIWKISPSSLLSNRGKTVKIDHHEMIVFHSSIDAWRFKQACFPPEFSFKCAENKFVCTFHSGIIFAKCIDNPSMWFILSKEKVIPTLKRNSVKIGKSLVLIFPNQASASEFIDYFIHMADGIRLFPENSGYNILNQVQEKCGEGSILLQLVENRK